MTKSYLASPAGKYAGPGHVRGFPGLVHTAAQIARLVPRCTTYIEPFAGLGRVAKQVFLQVKTDKLVLNDLSSYACGHNIVNFVNEYPGHFVVTKKDWLQCIKAWDAPGNFILFDPPWSKSEYANGCHGNAVCTNRPADYYNAILELLPYLQSDWIVCANKHNTKVQKSGYPSLIVEAESGAKIMGGLIKTLVISNKAITKHP